MEEALQLDWAQVLPIGAGMINVGGTCYLNAVLQCLAYTAPLASYMLRGEHCRTCHQAGYCVMCSVEKIIMQLLSSSGKFIKPNELLSYLSSIGPQFVVGNSQDAYAFLSCILDAMHKSEMSGCGQNKKTSLVKQLFEGCLRFRVECVSCKTRTDTLEPFMLISIPVESSNTLTQLLGRHMNNPLAFGPEAAYKCQKCEKITPFLKTTTIHQNSKVMVINMRWFDGYGCKVKTHVRYPEKLDMRPFMSESCDGPSLYQLYGVLVHVGSFLSGHFYCYVKASDGQWYNMDDMSVSLKDKTSALNQQACMLFYISSSKWDCLQETDEEQTVDTRCHVKASIGLQKRKRRVMDEEEDDIPAKRRKLECTDKTQTSTFQATVQKSRKRKLQDVEGEEIPAKRQKLESIEKDKMSTFQATVQKSRKRKLQDVEGEEIPAKRQKLESIEKDKMSTFQSTGLNNRKRKLQDDHDEVPAKRKRLA